MAVINHKFQNENKFGNKRCNKEQEVKNRQELIFNK